MGALLLKLGLVWPPLLVSVIFGAAMIPPVSSRPEQKE